MLVVVFGCLACGARTDIGALGSSVPDSAATVPSDIGGAEVEEETVPSSDADTTTEASVEEASTDDGPAGPTGIPTVDCFGTSASVGAHTETMLTYDVGCEEGATTCALSMTFQFDCELTIADRKSGFHRVTLLPLECEAVRWWTASPGINNTLRSGNALYDSCRASFKPSPSEKLHLVWASESIGDLNFCDAEPAVTNRECMRRFRAKYAGVDTIP